MKTYFTIISNTLLLLLFASNATAQALPSLNMTPTLSLSVDPVTPLPNSIFTVTANLSGATNVNNSNYSWFLNGIRQANASGTNKNVFNVKTGAVGTIYKIGATILTPAGDNLSDLVSVTVSDFDLTWSTANRAPAEYRGKVLPTQNSIITVSALPMVYQPGTKTLISPSSLIYNWSINDKFQPDKSGVNNYTLIIKADVYSGSNIPLGLEIKNAGGNVSIKKFVTVPIVLPQTLIYFADSQTNHPYGVALKSLIVKPMNLNFTAKNYFFNTPDNQLKWQWLVDNKEIANSADQPWLASLNIPSNIGLPFYTQIQAIASNPQNLLESAESIINLEVQ